MQRDRFLTGILVGIGVLVLLALILFFVRDRGVDYVDESTPAGVVQNYVLSLQRRDYERAHAYLSVQAALVPLDRFVEHFSSYGGDQIAQSAIEIGETIDLPDGKATVRITIIRGSGGIFDGVYRQMESVSLQQENGAWKITAAPYPYWDYGWDFPSPPNK
jgi:hypothetical protein